MRLGGLAAMGDFWRIIREFNPEGIERETTARLELWVVGAPGAGKRTLVRSLAVADDGADVISPFQIRDLEFPRAHPIDLDRADLVILTVDLNQDLAEAARQASTLTARLRAPVLLVFTHMDEVEGTRELRNRAYRAFSFVSYLRTVFLDARDRQEVQSKLGPIVLEAIPSLRMPLGRRIPTLRGYVAEQVIAETCKVNAQFALAANLPANIPFLGGIAGTIADFFVLTKNQVMMALRLAALYGRDISLSRHEAMEIAPVIGGGLFWRSLARMAVGLLPTFLAAAPKTAIAYVGTYVTGQAARYYYDEGRKAPEDVMKQFAEEGARLFKRVTSGEGSGAEPA